MSGSDRHPTSVWGILSLTDCKGTKKNNNENDFGAVFFKKNEQRTPKTSDCAVQSHLCPCFCQLGVAKR